MKTATREFGIVGLGRMGGGLALQALEKNIRVVGFDTHGASTELTLGRSRSQGSMGSEISSPRRGRCSSMCPLQRWAP